MAPSAIRTRSTCAASSRGMWRQAVLPMRSPGAVDSQRRHGHWAGIGCGRSWFLEQAVRWINQPEQDPVYIQASVATCRSLSECWNLTVDVGEAYAAHHLANGPPEPLPAPARMEWTQLPGIGPGTEILGGDLVGLRIVELGCGAGHNTAQLAAFGADAIGVDCPSGQIRRAVSHYRHTGAQFVHGSALMYLTGITGYLRAIVSVLGAIGLTEPPHCWPLPHAGSPRAAPSRSPYPTPPARRYGRPVQPTPSWLSHRSQSDSWANATGGRLGSTTCPRRGAAPR